MSIAFRVDASMEIGSGHVMRCLALASSLRENKINCYFICRPNSGDLISKIKKDGFEVRELGSPFELLECSRSNFSEIYKCDETRLEFGWMSDALGTISCIGVERLDWIVVDHYGIDAHWEEFLRPYCNNIMVIDDLANRRHDCDVLLDQNVGRHHNHYLDFLPSGVEILLGPTYALLRKEFKEFRVKSLSRRQKSKLNQLMISMGGADQFNTTQKILATLNYSNIRSDIGISVVVGALSPWLENVKSYAKKMKRQIEILTDIDNMAQVMTQSDLAIGAAGGSTWERCCLGLPSLTIVLADNQLSSAVAMDRLGHSPLLGTPEKISSSIEQWINFLDNPEQLSILSRKNAELTDGMGCERVLSVMKRKRKYEKKI